MNLPTLIVLLLVAAALVIAIRAWRRAGGAGSCGCDAGKCAGCSSAEGCPYCARKSHT